MTTKQAFALCALVLWTLTANAAVAPLRPTYLGVVIEIDPAAEPAARSLATTLKDSYGFDDVFELYGNEATNERILEVMDKVYEASRAEYLFVHLSLPIVNRRGATSFRVADSNPEEPWTSLTAEVVLSWLGALPAETVLFTYPSAYAPCDANELGRRQSEQTGRLAYGRAAVYELLRTCDLPAASSTTNSAERMRRITTALASVLDQRASTSPWLIHSVELAQRLGGTAEGAISFWIETAPLGADPRFFFSPVAGVRPLPDEVRKCRDFAGARRVKSLTGAALRTCAHWATRDALPGRRR
jgi:hypothetical protein